MDSHQQTYNNTAPQLTASTTPTPSPLASTSARLLHIYLEGFTQRRASVKDDQKSTLYTVDLHSLRKPHMKIFAASNSSPTPIATVIFHSLSRDIDLTLYDQPITLQSDSMWKGNYSFASRVTGGRFGWKMDSSVFSMGDMSCLDERGLAVARLMMAKWSVAKAGKIELVEGLPAQLMDEIVVSGLALMEMVRRKAAARAAGAGG